MASVGIYAKSVHKKSLEKSEIVDWYDNQARYIKLPDFLKEKQVYLSKSFWLLRDSFTLFEKRILLYIIGCIGQHDREKTDEDFLQTNFVLDLNAFKDMFNLKENASNIYGLLHRATVRLMNYPSVAGHYTSGQNIAGSYLDMPIGKEVFWFEKIDFLKSQGKLVFRFSKDALPFVKNFEVSDNYYRKPGEEPTSDLRFITFNLYSIANLCSPISLHLFLILQSRKDTNKLIIPYDAFLEAMNFRWKMKHPPSHTLKIIRYAIIELRTKLNMHVVFDYERSYTGISKYEVILTSNRNADDLQKDMDNFKPHKFRGFKDESKFKKQQVKDRDLIISGYDEEVQQRRLFLKSQRQMIKTLIAVNRLKYQHNIEQIREFSNEVRQEVKDAIEKRRVLFMRKLSGLEFKIMSQVGICSRIDQ